MKNKLSPYLPGILLLAVFIVIALFTYKDYGIAWDEQPQYQLGAINYNYIFNDDTTLNNYIDRDYGVGFELLLTSIEKTVGFKDISDVFLMRHLVTHLFFLFSMFAGYVLTYLMFRNKWLASLAYIMLVCHPRLYAHSFFNTKDIPLECMFMVTMLFSYIAFSATKRKVLWFVLLGAVCGYTLSIRVLGIAFVASLSLYFIIDIIRGITARNFRPILYYLTFIAICAIVTFAFWPYLWQEPINNFGLAFKNMSAFRWDGHVLLNGNHYKATNLPWYYIPEWFAITTPILWLATTLAGIAVFVYSFLRNPLKHFTDAAMRQILLSVALFIIPVLAIIILKSVVYDGWRHAFFIYPAFVMLGIYGMSHLIKNQKKIVAYTLTGIQLILVIIFMISAHPFQQVYFNHFVSHEPEYLRKNFERDYWGVSYLQAFNYILQNDTSDRINISSNAINIDPRFVILPNDKRKRLLPDGMSVAKYFITNYRGHNGDYDFSNLVYTEKVQNSTVIAVYKLQ